MSLSPEIMKTPKWEVVIMKEGDTNEHVFFDNRDEAELFIMNCPDPCALIDTETKPETDD